MHSFFFFFFLWLRWVFVAVHRLSLVVASGGYSSLQCAGFSLRWLLVAQHRLQVCGLQQLQHAGSIVATCGPQSTSASVVAAHGLSSCGLGALEHRLGSCGARAQLLHSMWDLPGPGIESMSPALAGGFLTTVPPGKSLHSFFLN